MNTILGKYSIIVDIPAPVEEAFIAIPFSKEFEQVQAAIERACLRVKLLASATNINPEDPKWLDDITQKTRRARMVVAVCSPETSTNIPNPNVMYELGFAASIGKATVILTSDINTLPADIRGQQVLVYTHEEVKSSSLVSKLRIAIGDAKRRARNRVTDSFITDVRFAGVDDWTITHRELWYDYINILHFAKDIHTVFQGLIGPLNTVFDSIPTKPEYVLIDSGKCHNAFLTFRQQQEIQFREKIVADSDWEATKTKRIEAILGLSASPITNPLLGKIPLYHQYVIQQSDDYLKKLAEIEGWIRESGGLISILCGAKSGDFGGKIKDLITIVTMIVMEADSLIKNMVDILPRGDKS